MFFKIHHQIQEDQKQKEDKRNGGELIALNNEQIHIPFTVSCSWKPHETDLNIYINIKQQGEGAFNGHKANLNLQMQEGYC